MVYFVLLGVSPSFSARTRNIFSLEESSHKL
jgi:hypothetical protein